MVSKLHGKELSFNNLLDLDSGRKLLEEFEVPAATILKHNNPCGTAVGKNAIEAYDRALACDPLSAYGGVYCFNRRVDVALAERLNATFVELVFAPGYDEDAFEVLAQKPNIRILEDQERRRVPLGEHDMRRVRGGILVQDRDSETESRDEMSVATERQAHGGAVGRPAVCLARVQARAVERDRPREGPRHGRDRRRPDEPSRFGGDRDREGSSSRSRAR